MHKSKAYSVVFAALGINLVIGVLYAWSIFKEAILISIKSGETDGFNWSLACVNDPYALCCLIFAFTMIPAGKIQDHFGARTSSLIGAVLGGIGFILISSSNDYWIWMIGFGGFVGAGIGFAYASTTPAALKWFSHHKSGLITGIVVSGFALSSTYIAPLASYFVTTSGLSTTMQFLGIQFFILISAFSFLLSSPPSNHTPIGNTEDHRQKENQKLRSSLSAHEILSRPIDVLKNSQFWILWILLFMGAGAGLMVIANIKPMAKSSMGDMAYLAIVILAIGDAVGRITSGVLSSTFGRRKVLSTAFLLQVILMLCAYEASQANSSLYIMVVATLIGVNYGVNLVLFPNYVKDFWGMKHFGFIYGLLFTAWGIGGFTLVKLSEFMDHTTGNARISFIFAGTLIFLGFLITFLIDNRKDIQRLNYRKQVHGAEAIKKSKTIEFC